VALIGYSIIIIISTKYLTIPTIMDHNTTYDDLPDMEDSFAVERWAWGAQYGELRYEIKELAIHLQKLKEVSVCYVVEANSI